MTNDDKALVERVSEQATAPLAERIETLMEENERLIQQMIINNERIDQYADRIEALSAENERLREALALCAKHVDWMPHPHCVEVDSVIRAALGEQQ